ncbi:hypothetical protein ACFUJY_24780 [Streptomyces sp. NPDC057249]|uniref:hypothetical protein n=1 Tax=Streptomyces sp. NPDC057249 TaxID=3346067 RepID=UPI00362C1204
MPKALNRRARIWIGGVALLALGAVGCSESGKGEAAASAKPVPAVTVTVTATETATPAPAPTVTETKTVKVPGPTVTTTVTKAASSGTRSGGSGGSSGGGGTKATGTCSIRSNAGNCYSAGQFCRNSDHGAVTTNASGARIRCSQSGSSWRWTYA